MAIQTIRDADTLVNNSGVVDWEWGGNASLGTLTEFVYRNSELFRGDEGQPEMTDGGLAAYLRSVGEDPDDYISNR